MDKNYRFCVITDDMITLYNDSYVDVRPVSDTALVEVTCEIDDNKNLIIIGDSLEFEWAQDRVNINELEHKPCSVYIKHYEPSKFYKLLGAKPYDYVQYWWVYRGEEVKYVLSNYKIKILK